MASETIERNSTVKTNDSLQSERDQEALLLKDLMNQYQKGDASAGESLVRRLDALLTRYIQATSLLSIQRDDLLQECWLRIHKARGSYRPGEPVVPWVLSIARHTRIDFYRRWQRSSGRETELVEGAEDLLGSRNESLDGSISEEWFLRAIRILPVSQREVIVMMKVTGMSIQEVAMATNSTPAAVKQKAYRAYQKLRQAMGVPTSTDQSEQRRGRRKTISDELA